VVRLTGGQLLRESRILKTKGASEGAAGLFRFSIFALETFEKGGSSAGGGCRCDCRCRLGHQAERGKGFPLSTWPLLCHFRHVTPQNETKLRSLLAGHTPQAPSERLLRTSTSSPQPRPEVKTIDVGRPMPERRPGGSVAPASLQHDWPSQHWPPPPPTLTGGRAEVIKLGRSCLMDEISHRGFVLSGAPLLIQADSRRIIIIIGGGGRGTGLAGRPASRRHVSESAAQRKHFLQNENVNHQT
jgi:hypothetical protein